MAFEKKTWKDRLVEYAGRKKITNVSTLAAQIVDMERAEGVVSEEGSAFSAANMNDFEQRVADGFSGIQQDVDGVISDLGGLSFYEDATGKYVVGADSVPKKLGSCNTYSFFDGNIINYSISVLDKNPNGSVVASIIADTSGCIKYNSTMNDWWYKYSTVEYLTKFFLDSKGFSKMNVHVNLNSEVSSLSIQLLNSENQIITSGTSNIKNAVSIIELDNVPEKFKMKIILSSPNTGPSQNQGIRNATGFIYRIELFS